MPDASDAPAKAPRVVQIQDSAEIRCPRCSTKLPATVADGYALLTCAPKGRRECGQRVIAVGLGAVAAVAPLSGPEFEELLERMDPVAVTLRTLGILGVPLMPAA